MTAADMVVALAPVASKMLLEVGGQLIEINTSKMTRDELVGALERSKSANWPQLRFISTQDPETAS